MSPVPRSDPFDGTAVGATHFTGLGTPVETFAHGRVCREPGCPTILSVYNPEPMCAVHAMPKAPRLRGRKADDFLAAA